MITLAPQIAKYTLRVRKEGVYGGNFDEVRGIGDNELTELAKGPNGKRGAVDEGVELGPVDPSDKDGSKPPGKLSPLEPLTAVSELDNELEELLESASLIRDERPEGNDGNRIEEAEGPVSNDCGQVWRMDAQRVGERDILDESLLGDGPSGNFTVEHEPREREGWSDALTW